MSALLGSRFAKKPPSCPAGQRCGGQVPVRKEEELSTLGSSQNLRGPTHWFKHPSVSSVSPNYLKMQRVFQNQLVGQANPRILARWVVFTQGQSVTEEVETNWGYETLILTESNPPKHRQMSSGCIQAPACHPGYMPVRKLWPDASAIFPGSTHQDHPHPQLLFSRLVQHNCVYIRKYAQSVLKCTVSASKWSYFTCFPNVRICILLEF